MCSLLKVTASIVACGLVGSVSGQGAATCTAFDPSVGTNCVPDEGDFPSQCLADNPPSSTLTVTDKVECTVNFDCCTCETITCNQCTQVVCNGDSSCLITDFILNGDNANGGVTIDCNGDISCAGSSFTATDVKEVKCSGDDACASVDGTLDCVTGGCSVECGGDCSCPNVDLTVDNLSILKCDGDNACPGSTIFGECLVTGCPVSCVGDESCIGTTLNIDNPSSFTCGGEEACSGSNVDLIGVINGPILLGGQNGFKGSSLTATGSVSSFECSGVNVCEDATVSIDSCGGDGCTGLCGGTNGCLNANIDIGSNVNGFNCDGTDACNGATISIGDIGKNNEFSLGCNAVNACKGTTVDVTIDSSSITQIKSISCGATDACDDLVLNMDASGSGNNVVIEKFECGGASACDNLAFNFVDVSIGECVGVPNCNTVSECSNCS